MSQFRVLNNYSWFRSIAILAMLFLSITWLPSATFAQEVKPDYDLDPYSVKIEVIFADQIYLSPQLRKQLIDDLHRLNRRTYGEMWKRTVEENSTLLPRTLDVLERTSPERMKADYSTDECDKVFLCFVARKGLRYEVAVREWDTVLENFSLTEVEQVLTTEEIPVQLNNLMVRTFRPMAKIRKVDRMENSAQLILRAGEYPASDPNAAQVKEGDLFLPALRYLDKNNVVQKIQFFDWNYLRVEKIDRGRLLCSAISGAQTPLGSRGLRRVEQYGIRIRPLRSSTQIRLCKFNQPELPLVAHQVLSFLKNSYREDAIEEPTNLLSDRQGIIDVPLRPDHPVQWLYINSGSALLGRVPVVPGIHEFIQCPLPDDSTRLEVEGRIEELKGRIVEIIALRSSIMAEIRVAANKEKWDQVDQLLPRLDELPPVDELKSDLNTIRVLPRQRAIDLGNPVGARRIDQLADKTAPFIDKYLNPAVVEQFKEEIAAERAASEAAKEQEAKK
ncbi:MAG: hypothetical protein KDA65_10555 [Planctomycetaceae bacterium]|nr:hypothetical protein [Planctomycetaceae bacterium]